MGIPFSCLGLTQHRFLFVVASGTFLWLFTKFPAGLSANPLFLQHIHITVWRGQTCLRCKSAHPWLSQPATCSSGMWLQKMLLNILHGCHFDIISSFSIKNSVPDTFDQPSYSEIYLPVLQDMLKMFPIGLNTFFTHSKQILAHIVAVLWIYGALKNEWYQFFVPCVTWIHRLLF
jgi:hypothetical protein